MKVLHIEDNQDITDPIKIFLESKGYECEAVTDGKKGLQLIRENHYDIILLDLNMPGFSGFDVINGLVRDGSIKNEKIILFTASVLTAEQMNEFREMGVHSSIGKPIINEKLLEKIKLVEQNYTISTNISK